MQWTPNARPQEQRRPYRDVLDALQERVRPFIERQPEFARPAYGSVLQSGADMLPGVGDVVGVEDLQAAARDGDPVGIGLGLLAAIPGIPAIGRGSRGARRGLMTGAREAAPSGGLMTDAESALARYRAVNPDDTGARVLNPGDEGYPTNAQWDEASQAYVAPVEPDYPIRAYHGSPHSFDQFSLDKIGTGEGAQAYGHGLYFAESEDVARSYRDQLSRHSIAAPDGRVVPNRTLGDDEAALEALDDIALASGVPELSSRASRYYHSYGDIMDTALQRSDWDGLPATIRSLRDAEIDNLEKTYGSPEQIEAAREAYENAAQAAEYANRNNLGRHSGSMYEVGINAHPDTFLDWDRPLSEQSEAARAAAARIVPDEQIDLPGNRTTRDALTGEQFYRMLGASEVSHANARPAATNRLQGEGINGIRYLDGNSRSAQDVNDLRGTLSMWESAVNKNPADDYAWSQYEAAEAALKEAQARLSSNYVVFNDELVKILRKYGMTGVGFGLGASALSSRYDDSPPPPIGL